jgi:hypothetical protein
MFLRIADKSTKADRVTMNSLDVDAVVEEFRRIRKNTDLWKPEQLSLLKKLMVTIQ